LVPGGGVAQNEKHKKKQNKKYRGPPLLIGQALF
jgi:hypothetical protein